MAEVEEIRTIVVAVDGSEESLTALRFAVLLARLAAARVVAVCAYQLDPWIGTETNEEIIAGLRRDFETQWVQPLRSSSVSYQTVFAEGDPGSILFEVADTHEADVVVVGRRGKPFLAEMLLGSVAHQLVHHSTRPVVVVPTITDADAEHLTELS